MKLIRTEFHLQLVYRCNICNPDGSDTNQYLRTSTKSNGNILKHIKVFVPTTDASATDKLEFVEITFCIHLLQRRHPDLLEKIKVTKAVKSRAPRMKIENGSTSTPNNIKKQPHDSDEEYEEKMISANEEQFNTNEGLYVIEPIQCEPTDSEQEEYVEFELDGRGEIEETLEEDPIEAPEYEIIRKSKRKRLSALNIVESPIKKPAPDHSLIELQKKLLQAEHDEVRKQRAEKHQLEIAILRAELAHKTMEHQKRMEVMTAKLNESTK